MTLYFARERFDVKVKSQDLTPLFFLVVLAALALPLLPGSVRALKTEKLEGATFQGKPLEVVSQRVLVRFSHSMNRGMRESALSLSGLKTGGEIPRIGWTVVSLPPGMTVAEGLKLLRGSAGVEQAEPDHVYRVKVTPNDPLVPNQTNLSQVNAFAGWNYTTGTSTLTKVTVAVIDTGIDQSHADLSAKFANTASFNMFFDPDKSGAASADNPATPACQHATEVSGIAAASTNNGVGIAGMSWGAQLLSVRVFNKSDCLPDCTDATGGLGCSTDDVAVSSALVYVAGLEGKPSIGKIAMNLSIGGSATPCISSDGTASATAVAGAIALSTAAGIPVAIAAGNDGMAINAPANCAGTGPSGGVIPVGATTQNNTVATSADWGPGAGSSVGPEMAANGVVAPGTNVETTEYPGGGYTGQATGTSFSTPHVAGLAALVLAARPDCNGQNCAAYVQSVVRGGAQNVGANANAQGAGQINVFNSLQLSQTSSPSNVGEGGAFAFPNPFRISQSGSVSFSIPKSLQAGNTTIKIYTISGRLVNSISELSWDGRNSAGALVASGTYLFIVETDKGRSRGRFALIR